MYFDPVDICVPIQSSCNTLCIEYNEFSEDRNFFFFFFLLSIVVHAIEFFENMLCMCLKLKLIGKRDFLISILHK